MEASLGDNNELYTRAGGRESEGEREHRKKAVAFHRKQVGPLHTEFF